jgi:serine/threonine protein phosphatase PrpC
MAKQYPIEATLYEELPNYKVTSLRGSGVWKLDGDDYEELDLSTRSISTYPLLPGGEKDGDPIADRLYVQRHENRALLAVADGCNWGKRPQMAAKNAVAALANYFTERQADIRDLHDAGHFLLRSFSEAHYSIVHGKEDIWEAGTTTLLGILVLELEQREAGDPRWGLLCGSVGDCKAFHVNMKTREILDITSGNRDNVKDSRDPGGRLGPYEGHGWPDLRNLRLYFSPAEENDIIVVVSDGVHDNLDPQTLGKFPSDINLPNKSWDELTGEGLHKAKALYMKNLLGELIFNSDTVTPASITENLMKHCWAVTSKSREFMEKHPNKKQPTDYVGFPGKMDHTTCISFVIGKPPVYSNNPSNNNQQQQQPATNDTNSNGNSSTSASSTSPSKSPSSSSSSSTAPAPTPAPVNGNI